MNRVEVSAAKLVPTGIISPLECGAGVTPVSCTPIALAAVAVAAAACAYYAVRDCSTGYMDERNLEVNREQVGAENLSAGDLIDGMRSVFAG
ncbi:hypothetical protein [Amycolatopsis sp. H20-H5]|uniref:hypothetical protein n=1 Tax=Amycolatopsis sp. H20-H5 TaxID=3046309 RepID=UPI002DBBE676|nr:hypothetical protein [Amycolatopsis sp. H20-H5]MEC3975496.1 hypothetical protein [Amycolatopsis sp. H20-H5]